MSGITARDWRVLEGFLNGKVTLIELGKEDFCSNGTRVLVAQAVVLGVSQEYIADYEGMLLKMPISDIFRELFPEIYSGRLVSMSRSRGLHCGAVWNGQRTPYVRVIPAEGIEELLDRYKTKNRLAPMRASLAARRKENESTAQAEKVTEETSAFAHEALATAGRIVDDLRRQHPPLVLQSIAYQLLSGD